MHNLFWKIRKTILVLNISSLLVSRLSVIVHSQVARVSKSAHSDYGAVQAPKDRGESYSLACGKLIPVKEVDSVSVYISQPVPCR